MINEIFVFDDIIDVDSQNLIETYCKQSTHDWEHMKDITFLENDVTFEMNQFPAKVLPSGRVDSIIDEIILKIQKNCVNKINLEYIKTYRSKINWTYPIDADENEQHKLLHVDKHEDHIVIVYYVNDIDGDTLLFNNRNGNTSNGFDKQFDGTLQIEDFELLKTISPKKGRVAMFNGNLYHYGKYPKNGDRYVVNINLVAKEKSNKNLI
jgi:hypothetical protein